MQVVINLTSNALKFTQEGSVCLKLAILESDGDDQFLEMQVKDTGVGIPYAD